MNMHQPGFAVRPPRRCGFTLVELLVVIAIIGVLTGLLLPAMQAARESGRRASCSNNLKQLATACQSHITAMGHYPTGGWNASSIPNPEQGADWRQPGGWAFTLLPFMDETNTYNASNRNSLPVPVFACPTRRTSPLVSGTIMTDYAGNRGSCTNGPFGDDLGVTSIPDGAQASGFATTLNAPQSMPSGPLTSVSVATGGIIFVGSSLPPARIRDGASNTYLFAEKYVPQSLYASGGTGYSKAAYVGDSLDTLRGGYCLPLSDADKTSWAGTPNFGGPHPGSFNAAFCDGSVRGIDFSINAQTHFLLSAREDRQPVTPP